MLVHASHRQRLNLIEAGQRWTGVRFEPQPLPYGSRPRLALVHICSEAVRTKRREIDIGRSTRDFLERLHIRPGGTDMRLFRRQMMALSAARMTFGFGGPERPSTGDLKPIKRFDAWLIDEGGQQVAWPGELVLDADFLETLLEHAVPLDPPDRGHCPPATHAPERDGTGRQSRRDGCRFAASWRRPYHRAYA
jgi:hypothetical protein